MNKRDAHELIEALEACGENPPIYLKKYTNKPELFSDSNKWIYDYFIYTLSVLENEEEAE